AARLPAPALVVASGHGTHVYWKLAAPIDVTESTQWKKDLAALVGSDAGISDPPRVMRLPGFINNKPDKPHAPCRIVQRDPAAVVELADLPQIIPRRLEVNGNYSGERPPAAIENPKATSWSASAAELSEADAVDLALVRQCLAALSTNRRDSYDTWIAVGLALRRTLANPRCDMFRLWHEWSAASPKYRSESACWEKWSPFKYNRNDPLTFGSVRMWAREDSGDPPLGKCATGAASAQPAGQSTGSLAAAPPTDSAPATPPPWFTFRDIMATLHYRQGLRTVT